MCIYVPGQPFIPAPNTARVRMQYSYFGQTLENVWYFQGDVPYISSALVTLGDSIKTHWEATIKAHINEACTLETIELTALDSDTAPQVTIVVGETGGTTGAGLPGGSTFAIKFSTGESGRSSRGRMYWPSLSFTQVTDNAVNDVVVVAMLSDLTTLFDDVTTDTGAIHVVTSYCHNKAWRTTAVNTPVLTYVATDKNVDSQRRRLAGRGI